MGCGVSKHTADAVVVPATESGGPLSILTRHPLLSPSKSFLPTITETRPSLKLGSPQALSAAGELPPLPNATSPKPSKNSHDAANKEKEAPPPDNLQYICGSDVSFEWLFERLLEKFKCPDEKEPQWIAERLNVIGDKGKRTFWND